MLLSVTKETKDKSVCYVNSASLCIIGAGRAVRPEDIIFTPQQELTSLFYKIEVSFYIMIIFLSLLYTSLYQCVSIRIAFR